MKVSMIIVAIILVCNSAVAAIPTNSPPQFITKQGKENRLKRPWIVEGKVTVQTGWYATNRVPPKRDEQIRFDVVLLANEPLSNSPSLMLGQGYGHKSMINVHSYREALPSDDAIKGCKTISQLLALLGFPDWADGAPYNAHWHLFTIGASNSVETLTVHCTADHWDKGKGSPESLEVWRGIAHEARSDALLPHH